METLSMSLALCEGNPPVTGGFLTQKGHWCRALMFSLMAAWTKSWKNVVVGDSMSLSWLCCDSTRDQFRYAPNQWNRSLHHNNISHWLGTPRLIPARLYKKFRYYLATHLCDMVGVANCIIHDTKPVLSGTQSVPVAGWLRWQCMLIYRWVNARKWSYVFLALTHRYMEAAGCIWMLPFLPSGCFILVILNLLPETLKYICFLYHQH